MCTDLYNIGFFFVALIITKAAHFWIIQLLTPEIRPMVEAKYFCGYAGIRANKKPEIFYMNKNECNFSLCLISALSLSSTTISEDEFCLRSLEIFLAPIMWNNSEWLLSYCASSHGRNVHSRCDGLNNTITIVQVESYIFGGYTDIPWGKCKIVHCSAHYDVRGMWGGMSQTDRQTDRQTDHYK